MPVYARTCASVAYFVGLIFTDSRLENCENWTPQKFPSIHTAYHYVSTLAGIEMRCFLEEVIRNLNIL